MFKDTSHCGDLPHSKPVMKEEQVRDREKTQREKYPENRQIFIGMDIKKFYKLY